MAGIYPHHKLMLLRKYSDFFILPMDNQALRLVQKRINIARLATVLRKVCLQRWFLAGT